MRWSLGTDVQLFITLCADARTGKPNYLNDIIWEFQMGGGDPPVLLLQTSFGLRARWMRLFPVFKRNDQVISDPKTFFSPPAMLSHLPGYLSLTYEPYQGIRVVGEYWVPESHIICGRFGFFTHNPQKENLTLEWNGILSYLGEGEGLAVIPKGATNILQGKSGNIFPVCFITGGPHPGPGPLPSLALDFQIPPDHTVQFNWAMATTQKIEVSYEQARYYAQHKWDAEISRIELAHKSELMEITTGDPELDLGFWLTQHKARELFFLGNKLLPNPSFVSSRRPDQGYSIRGDGSDYGNQWNGQSMLDAYYLTSLILPGGLDYAEGLLGNYLSVQNSNGEIDLKPGMAGQRAHALGMPILATLACEIDGYKEDHSWLGKIFPGLFQFLKAWMEPIYDKDQDGFPEWDHPVQTGLEDAPIYDRWHPQSQGVDINTLETPSLGSFLFRECTSLIQIAEYLHEFQEAKIIRRWQDLLRLAVLQSWNENSSIFHYRDYQSHQPVEPITILKTGRLGSFRIRKTIKPEQRIQIKVSSQNSGNTRQLVISVFGQRKGNRIVETINFSQLSWMNTFGWYTGQNLFDFIERIRIEGNQEFDQVSVSTPNFNQEDISCLLPLWAGIPNEDQAKSLVQNTIVSRYAKPYGMPISTSQSDPIQANYAALPWNQLILEGMILYNYREAAAKIFLRMMNGIINALRHHGYFREYYHAETGQSFGEINCLRGFAPIGLFLKILGVRIKSTSEVFIDGINPFPWPVTVKYQGMAITRHAEETIIAFPAGQIISVSGTGNQRVTLP